MEFLNNYLYNMKQTPDEYYKDYNQAVINHRWEDTTQIRTVKEQDVTLNPFAWEDTYTEYEAWVDTVSDLMVTPNKVYSDFIEILPKDVDHKQNYRGQYYKLSLRNDVESTYICYDTINKLSQLPNFKCVRCNNTLTMVNSDNQIVRYPCYLGVDISSTNDYVAKSGITPNSRMIIMVQVNDDTKTIVNNQRFMFENSSAFEVEEINNFMQEEGTDGAVTIMRIYVKYSAILPRDNKELNLCDYYNSEHEIVEEDIEEKSLIVDPISANIRQGKYTDFTCSVVNENGITITQDVTYSCDWTDDSYYTIEAIDDGYRITNIARSDDPLTITFSSDGCEDIEVVVWLVNKF